MKPLKTKDRILNSRCVQYLEHGWLGVLLVHATRHRGVETVLLNMTWNSSE